MRLALFQPDIPQNLGAALRLGACLGAAVDIVEPCGFPLSDSAARRAALDYAALAVVERHAGWAAFLAAQREADRRILLFTTRAAEPFQDFAYRADDVLLFGRESAGAPEEVHRAAAARVRVPLRPEARSLNVAIAAGMVLGEALRQTGGYA
jgi:tRNA (cytidine/uridine-2'-O-)-methyltransferase